MIRLASIISRHEQLESRKEGNRVINKPTFKQIYEEYIQIEKVHKEMKDFVESKEEKR
jgi:hypothetical protein